MTPSSLYLSITSWVAAKLDLVSMAMVATLLAVYGSNINALVRKLTSPLPFLVRFSIFVALCAFGYGTMTLLLASAAARGLAGIDRKWLLPALAAAFLLLGFLAERKRQV